MLSMQSSLTVCYTVTALAPPGPLREAWASAEARKGVQSAKGFGCLCVDAMDSIKLISVVMTPAAVAVTRFPRINLQIPRLVEGKAFFSSKRTARRHVLHKLPRLAHILSNKQQVQSRESSRDLCDTVRVSGGAGETAASVSTSDEEALEDAKEAVMRAVSNTRRGKDTTFQQRQAILQFIETLEGLNPTADPIDSPLFSGSWALLYTAPVDEKTADKYAGTEEGPFLARVKPVALGSVRQTKSVQVLDTLRGTAQNIAYFVFFGVNGSLNIKGSVIKVAPSSRGATRVDVTFESFTLKLGNWTSPSISLDWINPKGWIDTTFLDEGMRVGRGDKGSVFVAVRIKQA